MKFKPLLFTFSSIILLGCAKKVNNVSTGIYVYNHYNYLHELNLMDNNTFCHIQDLECTGPILSFGEYIEKKIPLLLLVMLAFF